MLLKLFEENYTPDEGEEKYITKDIQDWHIGAHYAHPTSKCFYITLTADRLDTVSYKRLIPGKPGESRPRRLVARAFRFAVRASIQHWRETNGPPPADMLSPTVDHEDPPFSQLVAQFCEETEVSFDDIGVHFDGGDYVFDDEDFDQRWIAFHDERAALRWLAATDQNQAYHEWLNAE